MRNPLREKAPARTYLTLAIDANVKITIIMDCCNITLVAIYRAYAANV